VRPSLSVEATGSTKPPLHGLSCHRLAAPGVRVSVPIQPSWMHRKPGGRGGEVPDFRTRARENRDDDLVVHLPRRQVRRGYTYRCAKCGAECYGPAQFCPTHLQLTLRP
jgi:hypothetical protein